MMRLLPRGKVDPMNQVLRIEVIAVLKGRLVAEDISCRAC